MPRRDVLVDLAGRDVRVGKVFGGGTVLSNVGPDWYIDGAITHPGAAAEGQLLNVRMVQAIFDAESVSPTNPDHYKYPGETNWVAPRDPNRNLSELIANLGSYRAYGMDMMTVCMMGGATGKNVAGGYFTGGPGISAWNSDGSIKAAWGSRFVTLLEAIDAQGMVLNMQVIYGNRESVLADNAAVQNACENTIDYILDPATNGVRTFRNVLLEIGNEMGAGAPHSYLRPTEDTGVLISNLRSYVSTNYPGETIRIAISQPGGALPPAALRGVVDYYSLHAGASETPSGCQAMVDNVRGHGDYADQPIQFTEAGELDKGAAVVEGRGVGWGYYDQGNDMTALGQSDYMTGFQSPPVNWSPVSTALKQSVFEAFDSWA